MKKLSVGMAVLAALAMGLTSPLFSQVPDPATGSFNGLHPKSRLQFI